jgi:predicted  nucleic acid-binding Zn-ribbon protein
MLPFFFLLLCKKLLTKTQATNAEMATQLSNLKRPSGPDSMELRSLATRAANAERRLNNAQNQLLTTEEKLANLNQKTTTADGKWEARVKEYEARLKAAEERVKRERQGSKERVAELENSVKCVSFFYPKMPAEIYFVGIFFFFLLGIYRGSWNLPRNEIIK